MDLNLRKSALDHKNKAGDQKTLKVSGPSFSKLVLPIIVWFTLFIIFISTQSFTKREPVSGYLEATEPSTLLRSGIDGYVKKIRSPGDIVKNTGDVVAEISPNGTILGNKSGAHEDEVRLQNDFAIIKQRISNLEALKARQIQDNQIKINGLEERLQQNLELADLLSKRLVIAKKREGKAKNLNASNALTETELEDATLNVLSIEESIINNALLRSTLEQDKLDLQSFISSETSRIDAELLELNMAEEKTRTDLNRQEKDKVYLVSSPRTGITSNVMRKVGERVNEGDLLLTVRDAEPTLKAVLWVSSKSMGLLEVGQTIQIQYDAYPYQRFGTYKGVITFIGDYAVSSTDHPALTDASEPMYRIEASIEAQKVTKGQREFELSERMTFTAEVEIETDLIWKWLLEPFFTLKEG